MSGAELRGQSASGHHGGEEGPDWWALAVRHCGAGRAGVSACAGRGERAVGGWLHWAEVWAGLLGSRGEAGFWASGESGPGKRIGLGF